jgi:hypothetical protein
VFLSLQVTTIQAVSVMPQTRSSEALSFPRILGLAMEVSVSASCHAPITYVDEHSTCICDIH